MGDGVSGGLSDKTTDVTMLAASGLPVMETVEQLAQKMEITFGQLLQTFGDLLLVTLLTNEPSIVVQMIILLLNIICSNLVTSKKVLKQDKIHLIFMKTNLP